MRSVIVSYLQSRSADGRRIDWKCTVRYPSLGSLIDLRLMYSSYSKSPARLLSFRSAHIMKRIQTIELGMLPVERQFGQKEVDVIA